MQVSVAAPGKVLLTGGYLITERGYGGVVLVTDALFVTTASQSSERRPYSVSVSSPQFGWSAEYRVSVEDNVLHLDQVDQAALANRYVQIAALSALSYAYKESRSLFDAALAAGISVVILGDNDFYSQRHALPPGTRPSAEALSRLPAYNRLPTDALSNLRKTGLGSSAALVTSVVAALLHYVDPSTPLSQQREKIHNVAQLAHCQAQGRVGSGFDVSSAVYGSQRYERFSASAISELLAQGTPARSPPLSALYDALRPGGANNAWDGSVAPISLPPGLCLVLGDIDAGSNTPSLVGAVSRWRASDPVVAAALWTELAAANERVEMLLRHLATLSSNVSYSSTLERLAKAPAAEWVGDEPVSRALTDLAQAFLCVRSLLRDMGSAAGVPIEPPEQTALLDRCMALPGVVLCGVPGAGGYDAICCLVLGEGARKAVLDSWRNAPEGETNVCPLLTTAGGSGIRVVDTPVEAKF